MLKGMTMSDRMDFGNARGMRNTLEKLVQEQANRLATTEGEITKEMLQELTEADARTALYGEQEASKAQAEADAKAVPAVETKDGGTDTPAQMVTPASEEPVVCQ